MAVKSVDQSAKERLQVAFLVTAVALVQVAWGAALVFLAIRYL